MSIWTDFRDGALIGGLSNVLGTDEDDMSTTTKKDDTTVEKIAPNPTMQDKDWSLQGALMTVTQNQILGVTAAIVALLGLVYLIRK